MKKTEDKHIISSIQIDRDMSTNLKNTQLTQKMVFYDEL